MSRANSSSRETNPTARIRRVNTSPWEGSPTAPDVLSSITGSPRTRDPALNATASPSRSGTGAGVTSTPPVLLPFHPVPSLDPTPLSESSEDLSYDDTGLDSDVESAVYERLSQRKRRGSSRASSRPSSPALSATRSLNASRTGSPASRRSLTRGGGQMSPVVTVTGDLGPEGNSGYDGYTSLQGYAAIESPTAPDIHRRPSRVLSSTVSVHSASSRTSAAGSKRTAGRVAREPIAVAGGRSGALSASTSAQAAAAAATASNAVQVSPSNKPAIPEERNQQRRAKKAEAARQSRRKRKAEQESLEEEVMRLTARVAELEEKLGPEEQEGILPYEEFVALNRSLAAGLRSNAFNQEQSGSRFSKASVVQQAQDCILISSLLAHNVLLRRDAPKLVSQLCDLLPPPLDVSLVIASSIMPAGVSTVVPESDLLAVKTLDPKSSGTEAATSNPDENTVMLPSPQELAQVAFNHDPHTNGLRCDESDNCHFSFPNPDQQSKAAMGAALALTPTGATVPGGILSRESATVSETGSSAPLTSAALNTHRTRGTAILTSAAASADAGQQQPVMIEGKYYAPDRVKDTAVAQLTSPEMRGVFIGALQHGSDLAQRLQKLSKSLISQDRQVNSTFRGLVTALLKPSELIELMRIAEDESQNLNDGSRTSSATALRSLVDQVRTSTPTLHECMDLIALRELQLLRQRDQAGGATDKPERGDRAVSHRQATSTQSFTYRGVQSQAAPRP